MAVDLATVARRLASMKLKLAIAIVVSLLAAVAVAFDVDLRTMSLEPREYGYGAASLQIAIDSRQSPLRDASAELQPLVDRARLFGAYLRSERVRTLLARRLGVPPEEVALLTGISGNPKSQAAASGSAERRGSTLRFQGARYRLLIEPVSGLPVIGVNILAPTGEDAQRLAMVAAETLPAVIRQDSGGGSQGIRATPVGTPVASEVVPSSPVPVAAAVFLGTLLALTLAWLFFANVVEGLQRTARDG